MQLFIFKPFQQQRWQLTQQTINTNLQYYCYIRRAKLVTYYICIASKEKISKLESLILTNFMLFDGKQDYPITQIRIRFHGLNQSHKFYTL